MTTTANTATWYTLKLLRVDSKGSHKEKKTLYFSFGIYMTWWVSTKLTVY